jgi:hypothetical protein
MLPPQMSALISMATQCLTSTLHAHPDPCTQRWREREIVGRSPPSAQRAAVHSAARDVLCEPFLDQPASLEHATSALPQPFMESPRHFWHAELCTTSIMLLLRQNSFMHAAVHLLFTGSEPHAQVMNVV